MQRQLNHTAASLSDSAGTFLIGLLKADERDRIGCGPEGFIAIQRHPWFTDLDWVALLRKKIEPPWLPPPAADGAAPCDAEFHPEGVMGDKPFDESLWAGLFSEFGPMLPTPTGA